MESFAHIVTMAAFFLFIYRRMLRFLHIYQQEEYDSLRFARWLIASGAYDKRLTIALLVVTFSWLFLYPLMADWVATLGVGLLILIFFFREPDPRKVAKKPLSLTKRAKRILTVGLATSMAIALLLLWLAPVWGSILAIQLAPFYLMAANAALSPYETKTQRFYWKQAHQRLNELNPMVIAITGSFGKTSVKHLLGHLLNFKGLSFVTPGSVNTQMGIARVIRESLPPHSQYFVVEMGAYGKGAIASLCQLTPPKVGIITAIGEAHYERFKSLEAVAQAKFELATAVLKSTDGVMIAHISVMSHRYAREFINAQRDRFILCGKGEGVDLQLLSWSQGGEGLLIAVSWQGKTIELKVPIYGAQNVENVLLVIGAAIQLGFTSEQISAALGSSPQINHRLEVKRKQNGVQYIDDAYNSNPIGFAAALELLTTLREGGAERILVTPGMVELGARHDELHLKLGRQAADHVDRAIIVQPARIPTFIDGLLSKMPQSHLHTVETFADARLWLENNVRPQDVVLIENDLPDLYESSLIL